ncbi:MAG: phosphotransferase family protein [Haloarculaceae archaeon]
MPPFGLELDEFKDLVRQQTRSTVDVSEDDVIDLVARVTDREVTAVERDAVGAAGGVTFFASVRGREPDVVVQVAHPEAAPGLHKGTVLYRHVGDCTEVRTPAVAALDPDPTDFAGAYAVVERIPGYSPEGEHEPLSRNARRRVLSDLGRVLGEVHREVTFEGFGQVAPTSDRRVDVDDPHETWTSHLTERLDRQREVAAGTPVEDLVERAYDHAVGGLADLSDPRVGSLLHQDLRPGNVVVEDGRLAALVDWDGAVAGDPAFDLHRAQQGFADETDDEAGRESLRNVLYEGYTAIRDLPPALERRREVYDAAGMVGVARPLVMAREHLDREVTDDDIAATRQEMASRLDSLGA